MSESVFRQDMPCTLPHIITEGKTVTDFAAVLSADVSEEVRRRGEAFADEIERRHFADFERSWGDAPDKMVHVSTFCVIDGTVYMTYYENTETASEDPNHQTARIAYCPADDPSDMTVLDVQSVGDEMEGRRVSLVYDTIFAQTDDSTLMLLWTAKVGDCYYRLCRTFSTKDKTMGAIRPNRFRVCAVENDFSTPGIQNALAANGLPYKTMYNDIGIMQKFTSRVENGETWYYTGTYSGDFNAIIKSRDFITWEFVAQPDFANLSQWENTCYVIGDRCYYFVRQHTPDRYGFLTYYDLEAQTWAKPVLIEDSQSRGDFYFCNGALFLFHAPIDRDYIGVVRVDTEDLASSEIVLQAHMHSSCFYPFVQDFRSGTLGLSYTVARQHIRLGLFDPAAYLIP